MKFLWHSKKLFDYFISKNRFKIRLENFASFRELHNLKDRLKKIIIFHALRQKLKTLGEHALNSHYRLNGLLVTVVNLPPNCP